MLGKATRTWKILLNRKHTAETTAHACMQEQYHTNRAVDLAKLSQGHKEHEDLQGRPLMMGGWGGLGSRSKKKSADLQGGRKGWSSFSVGDRLQPAFSQLSSQSRVTLELISLSQPLLAPHLSCKSLVLSVHTSNRG